MPTTTAHVPEIVLGDRIAERIARNEQAGDREALIVARRDIGARWHHAWAGIDRRGHREALGPWAPLRAIADPYPQRVRPRAGLIRGLGELGPRDTVPYSVQRATVEAVLTELQGKVLVDATVPLMPPRVGTVQLPAGRSAVAAIQQLAGNTVRVVSAFQNVSAQHLNELDHEVDCDVLVCGNDREACEVVIGLCSDIGLRGFYAGPIENSAAAEALTSVLITINRRYKIAGAGIRITGPK